MKKLILAAIAVLGFVSFSNAQEGFKVGANVGLPVGDASDYASFSVGLDVAYLAELGDSFYLGGATGFINGFGDDQTVSVAGYTVTAEADDVQYIPVAASARYLFTDAFYVGADLGYGIAITDGLDGGFYYKPKVGYQISDLIGVNVSYVGVAEDGASWNTVNAGVEFSF
ncbi:outer membrane beta-barrel protein [Neptunitalea lumnitzerae]|uniref:Outer membrane protein beta-barrel domain-containing protein n=1 Tax=Neptunitalea lumnitzerae TaxID=2965509 RepID=A0ABQ5MKI2_9FLAO|nr:outer membrane beta-barrel protein [Neptunitalea sp. Y10]GLB49921.1 hypothetical protein Y10_22890 [Neptunitalea sp. Y10]